MKRKKWKIKRVCPICLRTNCTLFIRMNFLKFTDEERAQYIFNYHLTVCPVCKRLRCDRESCDPKSIDNVKKQTPEWWQRLTATQQFFPWADDSREDANAK